MAIRVLLVDDQPLLRTGFRMILEAEQDIAVVGEAGDGLQALDQVRALQPDVVLMDIRMPRMDGVEATRQITGPGRDGPAKVLVLTTFDLDEYVVEALRAGASGFLLKDAPGQRAGAGDPGGGGGRGDAGAEHHAPAARQVRGASALGRGAGAGHAAHADGA